jgi:hypothetical protein
MNDGDTIMTIRFKLCALGLSAALLGASSAQAWFSDDERPPPNGANGLSANGFSVTGFTEDGIVIKGAVMRDGSRVVFKDQRPPLASDR